MFDYIPTVFKGQYAETIEEADQWLKDNDSARRTPDLLPRDEVARAINSEVKAGRNSPHGGVFLDIASRLPAEEIQRRRRRCITSSWELAEVDITKEPMEVGPTCHYVMGGIESTRTPEGPKASCAEPVGTVHAARAFACGEQARLRSAPVSGSTSIPPMTLVACRPDFHRFLCDVDLGQLHELVIHRRQPALDLFGGQPRRDVEEHAAVRRVAAGLHPELIARATSSRGSRSGVRRASRCP